jgi:hypothetical protein
MRNSIVLGAVCSAAVIGAAALPAQAGTVFISSLTGANERPPIDTHASATGTLTLTGTPGHYVAWYTIDYKNLSSDPTGGHIHYAVIPPNKLPSDQNGPVVSNLDSFPAGAGHSGRIAGDWRWDEASHPLTNELVDSMFDGELYFNIASDNFPTGEIRGQILDPNAPTPIPLPPAVLTGFIGLGAAGFSAMRFGRTRKV